ncbi:hypothetical protein [Mesorhizobium sp. NZP2077]|uniref:hypothetical protein n=1 Tax=Mesorhizobium sp. NZP2077 TaxID=2483404 RepID=UPI001555D352|nr:hypothetical protein [Mesorhizobium sp. NZP2077]QKC83190.1 hypothetical protein EB232_17655 [Mesorhizobium sp. NZP2077]QKD16704.1 hypothetical protein HGP13_17440 [Mesorhizobium sp. NZP2077]
MRKFHPAYSAAYLIIGAGVAILHGGYASFGLIEAAVLVPFLIAAWWVISDFSGCRHGIDSGSRRRGGIGSRFGAFLSRLFRDRRGP